MAAADWAEGEGEPPPELGLAFQCERWGALPVAGGILDQPLALFSRMDAALSVYRAFKSRADAQASKHDNLVKWGNRHPELEKMCLDIDEARGITY